MNTFRSAIITCAFLFVIFSCNQSEDNILLEIPDKEYESSYIDLMENEEVLNMLSSVMGGKSVQNARSMSSPI